MGRESITFREEDIPHVVSVVRKGLANSVVPDRVREVLAGRCNELEDYWGVVQDDPPPGTLITRAREECARWVCMHCNNQETWDEAHLEGGYWVHRPRDPKHMDNLRKCHAEEIWEKIGGTK